MSKTIVFRSDRTPQPGRVHVGFETDNMVERLAFVLPQLDAQQTAMLMLGGTYVNMVQLSEGGGVYYVDMTAELIGKAGEAEGYVVVNTPDGRVWNSAPFVLITGDLPDIDGELQEHFPDAIQQMRQEIAEHNAEMAEQAETAHAAVNAAEAAARRSEAAAESFVEKDPTVPEWAKQPSKPVYSSEEVGAPSKVAFEALAAEVGKKQPAGDYASKDDIPTVPTKLSAFENDVGYAANLATWAKQPTKPTYTAAEVGAPSKQELNVLAAKVDNKQPKGDYALKSEIPKVTGYATEAWVGTQLAGYQPKGDYQPAGDYALKSELPSVPTQLSELAQDATHRLTTDEEKAAWNAKVKTVNGTAPDANGNVQIETGGGVTSWNDIEDRPFGDVYGDTLTWDGNTEGLICVEGFPLYKLSDEIVTMSDLKGGFSFVIGGEESFIDAETAQGLFAEDGFAFMEIIAFVPYDSYEIEGLVFPSAGTYLMSDSGIFVSRLTIEGYGKFVESITIDAKYLPDMGWVKNIKLYASKVNGINRFYKDMGLTEMLTDADLRTLAFEGSYVLIYQGDNTSPAIALIPTAHQIAYYYVETDKESTNVVLTYGYTAEYTPTT